MAKGIYHEWITPDGLLLVRKWRRAGLTEEQIAHDKIHISPSTLGEWKNRFPEFAEAIKKGRETYVAELEDTLKDVARGYTGPDGKYYPPNVTALIFALKCLGPDVWRERHEVQGEVTDRKVLIAAPEEWTK